MKDKLDVAYKKLDKLSDEALTELEGHGMETLLKNTTDFGR